METVSCSSFIYNVTFLLSLPKPLSVSLKWSWCVQGQLMLQSVVAVRSGSVDVVPTAEAQGGGTLPALQGVLDHVLPLVI